MILATALATAALQATAWTTGPELPAPVTNNAVAAVETTGGWEVYSFLGLDESMSWEGVNSRVFRFRSRTGSWSEIGTVEGPGRLAGTAQTVGGLIYLFGGYTVDAVGSEQSMPSVDIWDPATVRWGSAAAIPVPTDDAVSGVWDDRIVYLVSGWHDTDNIPDVQGYDATMNEWFDATPIPGPPVFGHAGALSGNTIVYIDGVRVDSDPRAFALESSSWRGDIDPDDPTQIQWRRIDDHPGPPLYRAASVAVGPWVIFAGGTDNPYNYDGVGYNGEPAEPLSGVFAYHVDDDRWVELDPLPVPTMDHRGIVQVGNELGVVGGMEEGQRVSTRVQIVKLEELLSR